MNIGKSIKVALVQQDMRQKALAEKLGVTHIWISRLANKKTADLKTVAMLADAFGMKVSEFVALGED